MDGAGMALWVKSVISGALAERLIYPPKADIR